MRVRRFLFAVRSKGSCPWACQSVEAQGCAKHARHTGKLWQLFANRPTAGACMAQAECGLAAWSCLVGLGYFATLSGLIGLAGKYFAQVFSGLRGRMPEVGALAKKLRHGCVLGSTAAKHDWAGHVCAIQIRPMAKVSGKRHILSFPVPGAKSMPQIGICCWRAKSRRRRPREQHVGLQKRLRRNDHKKGGTRRFPL